MSKKHKIILLVLFLAISVFGAALIFGNSTFAVLNPQGTIASQQRDLMVVSTLLMAIIVIPVFVLTFGIAWKYREGNTDTKVKYTPDWDGNRLAETVWWLIPLLIIGVLSVLIWRSSHALDPYKQINSDKKPLRVQVVALEWKWLFIYPEQNIATVNHLQIPEQTPINFEITADAPMNSFWIPQLGGQVYAMPGMTTRLHLMADSPGNYKGSSANLSGEGFAGMKFDTQSLPQADFDGWVREIRQSFNPLTNDAYGELAKPTKNNPPVVFATTESGLYDKITMKYMHAGSHGMSRNQVQPEAQTDNQDHGSAHH